MKLTRILPIAVLPLAFALMTSCDSTSSSTNGPGITAPYLDNGSLTAGGGATPIHANVTSDKGISSLSITVMQGATNKTSDFTLTFTVPATAATSWSAVDDGHATIAAKSTAASGSYDLVVTVTDANGTSSSKATFTVGGGTSDTALTSKATLDVGAQGVSNRPSFISLGTSSAKSASAALANVSAIDLVITYDVDVTTQTNFESTAEGVGDGSLQNNAWGTGRHTIIKDLGTTAPAGIQAVRSALSGFSDEFAAIVNGHYYATKSADGVYAVLKVSNASGTGNNMTLTVDVLGK